MMIFCFATHNLELFVPKGTPLSLRGIPLFKGDKKIESIIYEIIITGMEENWTGICRSQGWAASCAGSGDCQQVSARVDPAAVAAKIDQ
jgi:hypothetical protein